MTIVAGRDMPARLIEAAAASGRDTLTEPDSKAFLAALGIPVPFGLVVQHPAAAVEAFARVGSPAVVKAVAWNLTHKTDAGGVVFPVHTGGDAEAACRSIAARVHDHRPDVTLEGFLIETYRPAQPEWILGLRVDPSFGPAVMFGLGGIFVEILHQVSFRLAPLREQDIEALLTEKPAMRILDGARGKNPADREALKDVIRRLSDIARRPNLIDRISEIDINPLTIGADGVLALDALIVLRA